MPAGGRRGAAAAMALISEGPKGGRVLRFPPAARGHHGVLTAVHQHRSISTATHADLAASPWPACKVTQIMRS